jgi:hypothetical protein
MLDELLEAAIPAVKARFEQLTARQPADPAWAQSSGLHVRNVITRQAGHDSTQLV